MFMISCPLETDGPIQARIGFSHFDVREFTEGKQETEQEQDNNITKHKYN